MFYMNVNCGHGGEDLVKLGLPVESLDGEAVELAQSYRRVQRALTVADSFALALAKRNGWILLTGDGALRDLAGAESVECHGVLWLLDILEGESRAPYRELCDGLEQITANPKCRLPKAETRIRLQRYRVALEGDGPS